MTSRARPVFPPNPNFRLMRAYCHSIMPTKEATEMWIKLPQDRLVNASQVAEIRGFLTYIKKDVDANLPPSERQACGHIEINGEAVLEFKPSLETQKKYRWYMAQLEKLAKGETSFVDLTSLPSILD